MMKSLIFLLLIAGWQITRAQSDKHQINNQVGKPFILSLKKQYASMFLMLGSFFGRFTIGLRRENNVRKIFLDSDQSEGMTEKIFLSGKKMDD